MKKEENEEQGQKKKEKKKAGGPGRKTHFVLQEGRGARHVMSCRGAGPQDALCLAGGGLGGKTRYVLQGPGRKTHYVLQGGRGATLITLRKRWK